MFKSVDQLPGYAYNFVRKAIQSKLPTLDNLHRWGRAPSNLCPMCNKIQSNKHVLSNCSSSGSLNGYTARHNRVLKFLTDWISPKLMPGTEIYCDLDLAGLKQVSDIFVNVRPDIAIKTASVVIILELTVCHETNFISSRNYKLDKYKNIQNCKFEIFKHLPVYLYTNEISVLGFAVIDSKFFLAS